MTLRLIYLNRPRKLITVFILLLLIVLISQPFILIMTVGSDTRSNVIIDKDTIWTKEASPHIISGNTLVEQGVTLTIEAGTEIRFDEKYYLEVRGKLLAKGTKDDMIRFTANSFAPRHHLWSSIKFKENADDGSVLKYCIIEYCHGTSGYQSAVFVGGGLKTITDNFIHENYGGIYLEGTVTGSIEIRSNTIVNNTGYGGTGDSGNGIILKGARKDLDIVVSDNNIKNNFRSGIVIEEARSSSIVISNNSIIGNKYYGISIESTNDQMEIKNNLIIGNQRGGIRGRMSQVLEHNTITGHEIGIITEGIGSQTNYRWQNNNIYDNEMNIKNIDDQDWNFVNNWWGTTDTDVIEDKIYDYDDDFKYGKIEYNPILTSLNSLAPDKSDFNNKPPEALEKPNGNKKCFPNKIYNYTISTTDPDGDRVMYGWDWTGDGWIYSWSSFYESGETVTISHLFQNEGRYEVKVKAMDMSGEESEWSDTITIIVDNDFDRDDDSSKESKDQGLYLFLIMILIIVIILILIIVILFWRFKRIS